MRINSCPIMRGPGRLGAAIILTASTLALLLARTVEAKSLPIEIEQLVGTLVNPQNNVSTNELVTDRLVENGTTLLGKRGGDRTQYLPDLDKAIADYTRAISLYPKQAQYRRGARFCLD